VIDCLTRKGFEHPPFRFTTGPDAVVAARVRCQVLRTRCLTCRGLAKRRQSCHPACCIDCPPTMSNPLGPDIDATSRSRLTATDLPDSSRSGKGEEEACGTTVPTRIMRLLATPPARDSTTPPARLCFSPFVPIFLPR
jgi:hypothetical protein